MCIARCVVRRMAAAARKRAAGRTKNLALLSFGDEAEEEEAQMAAAAGGGRGGRGGGAGGGAKIRSAHDVLEDERWVTDAVPDAGKMSHINAGKRDYEAGCAQAQQAGARCRVGA